jgi:hypothetical protein
MLGLQWIATGMGWIWLRREAVCASGEAGVPVPAGIQVKPAGDSDTGHGVAGPRACLAMAILACCFSSLTLWEGNTYSICIGSMQPIYFRLKKILSLKGKSGLLTVF